MCLVVSLYCTIVQEWIAQVFSWRAKDLKAAVQYLIDPKSQTDPKSPTNPVTQKLAGDALEHPLFNRLFPYGRTIRALWMNDIPGSRRLAIPAVP